MRSEGKGKRLLTYLIIQLTFTSAALSQYDFIPKNKNGLRIVTTIEQYKKLLAIDTLQRMVAVKNYVQPLNTGWFYADTANFTHQVLYTEPEVFTRIATAEALSKVQMELSKQGLGLKFFDAYRPYSVTQKMWEIVPDPRYAADPAKGSGHNRGAAVDVTLVNLSSGEELPMPTAFDDFSEKAHADFKDLPPAVIKNRELLRSKMEKYGFLVLDTEWWHFYLPNAAAKYPLMNLSFRQMKKIAH